MLLKALEGVWSELGNSLINSISDEDQKIIMKQIKIISDEYPQIAKILRAVLELCERQDLFINIFKKSGITLQKIRDAYLWTDCVRESRSFVHYGAQEDIANSF